MHNFTFHEKETQMSATEPAANNQGEQEFLNLADLPSVDIGEDQVTVNPDADAFAAPAPVKDGDHQAKLMYGTDDPEKRWQRRKTKDGSGVYYATKIQARIIEPGNEDDNKVVFDGFVSTMMRNGTSRVIGVLAALGFPIESIHSHLDQVRALDNLLIGEPSCGIETEWEAQYNTGEKNDAGKDSYKRLKKGMKNFPQLPTGEFSHVLESPVDGSDCSAQARVVRYFSL
jgi:hypothetical protein